MDVVEPDQPCAQLKPIDLSNYVKLDIFKFLNVNQLNNLQLSNRHFNELIKNSELAKRNKYKLARNVISSMEVVVWKNCSNLLSIHYSLEASMFKDLSLGKFCDKINELFDKCSTNTLEHFKQKYDIINFAKKLPYFFVGLNTNWIYELAELFEKNNLTNIDIEKLTQSKLNGLLVQAFRCAQLDVTSHYKYFELNVSPFAKVKSEGITPEKGKFPALELNIAQDNRVLKLAFPAKILEPYRRVFFLLFVINRARYLIHILFGTSYSEVGEAAGCYEQLWKLLLYLNEAPTK
ncbi:hypothetical protein ACQ4LE_003780 [Meloidogyne hapla]